MAHPHTIIGGVCLGLVCLSFLFALVFTPLSYFVINKTSDESRSRAITWLRISWTLLLAWILLHFIRLIIALSTSTSNAQLAATNQLGFLALLISSLVLMSILTLQLELALAVRSVSSASVHGARGPRIAAYVGLVLLTVLSLLRFAAHEYVWVVRNFTVSHSMSAHYRLGEMANVLAFVMSLILLLIAVGTIIHTILITRATPLRKVFYLLLAMNTLTLLRELYHTIYAGLFHMGRYHGTFYYSRNDLLAVDVLSFVFNPTSAAVVLIIGWFVLHQKERGIWTNGYVGKGGDMGARSMSMSTVRRSHV
jgi:hypothetical protein